jgi:hypothetical protein
MNLKTYTFVHLVIMLLARAMLSILSICLSYRAMLDSIGIVLQESNLNSRMNPDYSVSISIA